MTSLTDLLDTWLQTVKQELPVCVPSVITEYDPDTHTASVQPTIRWSDKEDGVDPPIINGVPVLHPKTAKALIKMPVAKDDLVILVFADRSLDEWITTDGKKVHNAENPRVRHVNDCFAILAGEPQKGMFQPKPANPDALEIMVVAGTKVYIGNATIDLLNLVNDLATDLKTLVTKLQGQVDSPGSGSSGTMVKILNDLLGLTDGATGTIDATLTKLGEIKV